MTAHVPPPTLVGIGVVVLSAIVHLSGVGRCHGDSSRLPCQLGAVRLAECGVIGLLRKRLLVDIYRSTGILFIETELACIISHPTQVAYVCDYGIVAAFVCDIEEAVIAGFRVDLEIILP